ncbi:MAG TPA: nitroreductase family protein [Dehalococcoidales bacterium]|nr:nitroreductase family protein [Dehalococcoidales bacterium]
MEYKDLLKLVEKTRSLRRFKPDPVPDDLVDKMIEIARRAPSGFNQQPWEFVVIKKPELRQKIAGWCAEYMAQSGSMEATREKWQKAWNPEPVGSANDYSTAPVYILVLGDTRTQQGLPMGVRYDAHRRQYIYISSLANAFLYLHMAAGVLGLASQWVSAVSVPYVHCMIKDLLGIPETLEVYDMLVVGYPAVKARPKLLREKAQLVHNDDCGADDFRTDEQVKDFIVKARTWNIAAHSRQADS